MLFDDYNPLEKKQLQILDKEGKVVNKDLEPEIDDETLLKMYKIMRLSRMSDEKALQYQRQGRMLTFAPAMGQEGAQVGPMAASEEKDWLVQAFRETAALLYKGVTVEQNYLYWYGNERGSRYDDGVNALPVNVPIGSQFSHAAGIAYAARYKKTGAAAVAYIGDGGTSHGEFHEGVNFAGTKDLPVVFIIQNNHYAISTPREAQTRAATLAQKAVAYGIPGIQVDGNDPLAMYVATSEALKRARNGEGPTLIEAVTYRMGPHTTSDDPTLYREDSEVEEWAGKDPIKRFNKYLANKKLWNKEKDEALTKEYKDTIKKTFKKVEKSERPTVDEVFDYTYEELTPELKRQKEERLRDIEESEAK
ncbi:MAG: pyruvate dehydrogenase (acetyl-transferring) E1 component subunit alpha [Bacillota bacterium]